MASGFYPRISRAVVIAQDTSVWGVKVMLLSGQSPPFTFQVIRNGCSDPYRINQPPLPVVGTWGIVASVNADERMGYWLGAVDANYITSVQNNNDPYLKFESHYSGYVDYLDSQSIAFKQYADGTYLLCSTSTTPPLLTRTIVNQDQTLSTVSLDLADRINSIPSPRYFIFNHASGTDFTVDPSGSVSLQIASNGTLDALCGGSSVNIDSTGNTTITGASGASFSANFNGATISIDSSGVISITTPQPVNVSGSVINLESPVVLGTASGGLASSPGPIAMSAPGMSITASGGTGLALVNSNLLTLFNNHVHGNGNGGADTTAPTTSMTSSDLTSILKAE